MATFFLNDSDINTLKAVIRWYKQRSPNPVGGISRKSGTPTSGDVYLAKIPDGETLDAYDQDEDTPGVLGCDIYQPWGDIGDQTPKPMGFKERVLNFTAATFESNSFTVVAREKFGCWVVGGGSGGVTEEVSVCDKLKAFPEGDMETDTKLVAVQENGDCERVSQALEICKTFGTYTEEEHDEDVRLVGRDTATDTCHLYDVFSQIKELQDQICKLAAVVEALVDSEGIGGNDLCP